MHYASLAVFLLLTAAAAATGSQFMPGEWYAGLAKPAWTPPGWLFAPVWSVLYVMIAIAGWLAWQRSGLGKPVVLWAAQLVLNAAWTWIMFQRHEIGLALVDIVALWITILAFIAVTWRISRPAALLFGPYLLWISYASALNAAIWQLNP